MALARWVALLLLLVSVAQAAPKPIGNTQARNAERLFKSMEYEKALGALKKAAEWPKNTPQDLAWIALFEGVIQGELSKPDEAMAAFNRGLEQDPNATLPVAASPKVLAMFERARQAVLAKRAPPPPPVPVAPAPSPAPVAPPAVTRNYSTAQMLRSKSWIPAAAGGVLVAGGVAALVGARSAEQRLVKLDPEITTVEQRTSVAQSGRNLQTAGWALVGVGAAALGTAAGMFLFKELPGQTYVYASPTADGVFASVLWRM